MAIELFFPGPPPPPRGPPPLMGPPPRGLNSAAPPAAALGAALSAILFLSLYFGEKCLETFLGSLKTGLFCLLPFLLSV